MNPVSLARKQVGALIAAPIFCLLWLFNSPCFAFEDSLRQTNYYDQIYRQLLISLAREDFRQALQLGATLVRQSDVYDDAYARIIQAATSLNETKLAEDIFRSLLDNTPTNPKAYYGLGLLHKSKKEYRSAIDAFQRCMESLPDFPLPLAELVDAHAKNGTLNEAEQYLLTLNDSHANSPAINFGLGQLFLRSDRTVKAFYHLDQAFELNPNSPVYCYYKAEARHKAQQYNDALRIASQCAPLVKNAGQHFDWGR